MSGTSFTRRGFLAAGAAVGLVLAGCGGAPEEPDTAEAPVQEPVIEDDHAPDSLPVDEGDEAGEPSASSKILVVYYSRADENYPGEWLEVGHTKVMAGYIAEALGADEYEIVPKEAYPKGYDDCCDQAKREQFDDARPAIAGDLPDLSTYGTVFIGCPIWWGEDPMIIRTFVEGLDFTGKVIAPFTTHGGSGLGLVPSTLQSLQPNAYFREGKAVAGTAVDGARDEVVAWAHKVLG